MPKGKTNGNGHSNGNSEAIADRVQRYRRALEQNETRGDSALRSPDTPPNFGRLPIPQIFTFGSRLSTLAQVYRNPDEAVKDSLENARFMRNDPAIMECLEARQRSVALLNWHLEPEDKDDQTQKALVNELTLILKRIPNFTEYRRNLLEAIWYGRSAIQHAYGFERIKKQRRTILNKWRPINGDKLAFRWDDGSGKFSDDDVGIKVGVTWSLEDKLAGNRTIEFTDFGPAYFLEPWERTRIALHRHIIEDGAYEDPISAGRIHGVGVRDRIYWTWYQKQETMATLMELIERTGTGFTIYYYPDGNMQAKTQVESLAEKQKHDNILVMPRMPGDPAADAYGIERIEPSTAGISAMKEIIHEFFGHQMKRYILGQILSSESASTGLGSGVADLHQDTFMLIVQYDAVKLEETLTRDLVKVLQNFNFPEFRDVNIAFKIDTGSNESEKKMSGYKQAWDMGAKIRAVDVMDAIGASMPSEDEETLVNPTIMQQLRLWRQQQKAGQQAGAEPGSPEDMFGPLAEMVGGQQGAEGGEMGGEMPPEGPGGMPPDGGEGGPEAGPADQGPTQYAKRKPEQGELYEIQRRLNRALDGIHDETGTFCLGKVSDFWPLATNAAGVNGVDHWSVFYHGSEASAVVITSGHIRLGSRVWNFRNRQNDLAEVFTRAVMRLGQVAVERQLYAKKFEPDKHPRDENGKFSHSDAVASDIVKTIGQESLESIEAVVDEDQLSELIGDREPTVQDAFNALQSREDYVANYSQASKRVMRSVLRKMDSVLGSDDETAEPEDDVQELLRNWAGRAIADYFGKRGVMVPAAMVRYAKKRVKPAPGQMDLFGGGTVPHQASIDWKEELHPRGEGGKFALKGEGVGKLTGQTPAAKQADEAFALERPQESRQKWLDIDKPLAPLKKPVDLFGQPIKPAAKPTTAGAGKQTQPGLFSTKGAPGQMNLFEDKGVPEDMVQKPVAVKKPAAEDIAREAIEKGENISVTMKRRGLDHLGPMRREVADAVDRLKAEGVGKVEKPASESRKAAQEKALAKRAEEAKAEFGDLTKGDRENLPEHLKDINPAFPSEVAKLKEIANQAKAGTEKPPRSEEEAKARKWTKNPDGTYTAPNGTVWKKAAAGGEESPVTGGRFEGGQLMPIHGLATGQEKPAKKPAGEAAPLVVPSEKGKPRETPAVRPLTADQVEQRKNEERWTTVQQGPLGKILGLGDRPHGIKHGHGSSKEWMDYAEQAGPETVKAVAEHAKQQYANLIRDDLIANPWKLDPSKSGNTGPVISVDEGVRLALEHQQFYLDDAMSKGYGITKKHSKQNPDTIAARHWVETTLGEKGGQSSETLKGLHDAMTGKAAQPTATEGKPAVAATTSKPHHEVLHGHIMAGHVDEAVKHLEGLSKADARKAATDAGLPFHNAKTRKEILEGVRKIAENNTPEKRAARQKKEAIDNAHSDAREVLDNAEAHKNELLGAPITGDLTDEQVKNPHDPKHKPAVAAAWRAEVAKQIAKLHPDDPNADKLRARAEALETEQEQKQSAVNAATSEANQQPAAPAKADPRAAPPDPAAAAVPRVTNESFATGDWDMAHAGLGSELVISKMAVGMKGIEGREYGIREHSPGKWQLVSRPMASIESLTGGKADKSPDAAFPAEALAKGQKVEAEHTSDPEQAKEIAKDHLTEDTGYYDKLAEMEAKPKTPAKGTGAEQPAASTAPLTIPNPEKHAQMTAAGHTLEGVANGVAYYRSPGGKEVSRVGSDGIARFESYASGWEHIGKRLALGEGAEKSTPANTEGVDHAAELKASNARADELEAKLEPTHGPHQELTQAIRDLRSQPPSKERDAAIRKAEREKKKLDATRGDIQKQLDAERSKGQEHVRGIQKGESAQLLTSDQVESLPSEPGTQFEDTLDEAKKAGAVPSAKQVQSKSHKVADVISGKHSVGVPGSRSDEAKARAAGLYVNTVRGTTIFAKNAESAKPLEDYLKSGGKYGSDRFSELLGYSPQEIDEYRKFLSSTGQGHLIETAGEAVAAPEHSPAVQMAIVRAHHTLHDAGLAEKPAHPKVVASPSEIPYSAAYAAHQGTSFVPETRAKQRQEEYASTLNSHYEDLSAMVQTPEQQQLLDEEFFRFKEGFKKRYLAKLAADSRVMSSMITGPARFPTARNEKRNNTAHKRLTELLDYEKKAVQAIRGKINPTESGMIKSSDPNAVESLQAKLSAHENGQKRMRAVNDAHKRFLKDSASLDKSDLTDKEKEMVRNYKPAYSWEPHPYPPYRLSNNNAEIRRLKARIADVSSMKASAGKEESWGDVKLVENADAGRIQLVFPGKPDEATRTALKRQGFRWSPTEGAWQRHLNNAGRYAAESVLKSIGKTKEDVPGK